jgi:DHA3 family macrolide efflux protein-like MFS transporter
MSQPAPVPLGFRDVLAIASVRRLWMAQIVSVLGDFLAIFAVFAVATFRYRATPMELSGIIISFLLPLALVSPFAGVMVDRWDRKRTMIASDVVRALLVLGLLWAHDLRQIYAILACWGFVSSFFIPAQSVTLRTLVPPHGLMAANALMQMAVQATLIVSPAVAGLMVDRLGPEFCYRFNAASFLLSAALIWRISMPPFAPAAPQRLGALLRDLTTGLRFIFTHEAVAFVMISMTIGMFSVRCAGVLLAVYVRDILKTGPAAFGVLNSMVGVGMIAGSQLIPRLRGWSRSQTVTAGLTGAGASILLLAAVPLAGAAGAGMFGLGVGVALIFISAQTLLQESTPVEMLGRVSSSMMSSLAMAQVVAMTLAGAAAALIGIRNLYVASGAVLMLVAGVGVQVRRRAAA